MTHKDMIRLRNFLNLFESRLAMTHFWAFSYPLLKSSQLKTYELVIYGKLEIDGIAYIYERHFNLDYFENTDDKPTVLFDIIRKDIDIYEEKIFGKDV